MSGARESKGNAYLGFLASTHFAIHVYSMLLPVLLLSSYMPLMNSMISNNSDPENRSLAYSTNFVAVSLITSLSTTGTSMLIEAYDASVIFPLCLSVLVPCIAMIYVLMRRQKDGE